MKSVVLCVIALLLLSFSCNTTDPPPPPPQYVRTIELSAEDASCTEAWLRVRITDGSAPPFDIRLHRDGDSVQTLRLSTPDSLLIDEGLLPNQQYTYKAYRLTDSRLPAGAGLTDSSTQVSITTMDTTSHNWVFDPPVLLGDGSSSVLYDVAIVNDTLAYAVGAIYKRDSLGNWDPNAYNMVKWDGNTWELMRIPFIGPCSAVDYPPIKAIWVISPNQILLTNGGAIATYNGTTTSLDCRMNSLLTGAINKIFATSPQDIYAVGNNGSIVHFASGTWRRLESGTSINLQDIWGIDESGVWTCGYRSDYSASVLLRYDGHQWRQVIEVPITLPPNPDTLSGSIASLWRSGARGITSATSGGIYRVAVTSQGEAKRTWYPDPSEVGFFHRVRGSALNNMLVVGAFGTVVHFNGVRWQVFPQFQASGRLFFSTSVTSRQVMICGYDGASAIVLRGRPQ